MALLFAPRIGPRFHHLSWFKETSKQVAKPNQSRVGSLRSLYLNHTPSRCWMSHSKSTRYNRAPRTIYTQLRRIAFGKRNRNISKDAASPVKRKEQLSDLRKLILLAKPERLKLMG